MLRDDTIIVSGYCSPCGRLLLGQWRGQLCMADWRDRPGHARVVAALRRRLGADMAEGASPLLDDAARQLDEYFAGRRRGFALPLWLAGTEMQTLVWRQLQRLPYATVASYASVAAAIGRPLAVRAVARAVAANPLSVVVPCHRVVGSNGALTGYAGGIDAKRQLLALERDNAHPAPPHNKL